MASHRMIRTAGAVIGLLFAANAFAGEPSSLLSVLSSGDTVSSAELGATSARGLPDQLNQAVLQNNSVGTGSSTGTISNLGSMNGNAGLTTVLQNTGSNVLIQATTIVNVTIR